MIKSFCFGTFPEMGNSLHFGMLMMEVGKSLQFENWLDMDEISPTITKSGRSPQGKFGCSSLSTTGY